MTRECAIGGESQVTKPSVAGGLSALAVWLLLCFGAAAVGGFFRPGDWYATLQKPSWNPPGWVFGPVWTTLYTMMAVAAWLVWRRGGFLGQRFALSLFLMQLALNAAWSPLFFGLQNPGLAFIDVVLLWFVLLATSLAFWKVRPLPGALLVPYLTWVTFASVLNGVVWRMNL